MNGGNRITVRLGALACASTITAGMLVACGSSGGTMAPIFPADLARRIDSIVEAHQDSGLFPEIAIGVSDPERGSYIRAYGVADRATGRPADIHDRFRIGSATKTFTATAVLRLADEGKLSLDDVLEKYVPGMPNGNTIRLRDLLGMRGGVFDIAGDPEFADQFHTSPLPHEVHDGDVLQAIRAHADKALPPNTRTEYSNTEYFLLGEVLKKVTGKPLRDVFDDLTTRYGLHETSYPVDTTMPTPESRGYSYDGNALVDVTSRTTPQVGGAGAMMISTISDLVRYAPMLGRGDLLKPETFRTRTQFMSSDDKTLLYGLGIATQGQWIGHDGATMGYNADVEYLPSRQATLVVMVNQYTPDLRPYDDRLPGVQLTAEFLWEDLVDELYPGTGSARHIGTSAPDPSLPAPADLDGRLQQALDPNVPAAQQSLRIVGDDRDPELITRLARAFASTGTRIHVEKTNHVRHGAMMVTGTATTGSKSSPIQIPFTVQDGTWQILGSWACKAIKTAGGSAPGCG